MFDCSIFTEYTDLDLSCMSENFANKWRSRLTKEQARKLKHSRIQPQASSQVGPEEGCKPEEAVNEAPVQVRLSTLFRFNVNDCVVG